MTEEEFQTLVRDVQAAHADGRYDDEAALWERAVAAFPEKPHFLHNLALARMNQGRLQDALQLFEQTIAKDPTLSRAHNNRAALLIRLGVDVSDLLLPFATALATSETTDDFGRHLINLCMVAAYGTDQGGQDVLTVVDTAARTVIEEQCPEHQRGLILEYLSNLIAGFRDVAGFRAALAQRRWKEASGALCSARATFQRASLAGLVGGVDDAVRYLDLARRIFA